jgi:hypothetical protein
MSTKYFHLIHPPSPFPYAYHPPTGIYPQKDLFYFPVLHLLKKNIFVNL